MAFASGRTMLISARPCERLRRANKNAKQRGAHIS